MLGTRLISPMTAQQEEQVLFGESLPLGLILHGRGGGDIRLALTGMKT